MDPAVSTRDDLEEIHLCTIVWVSTPVLFLSPSIFTGNQRHVWKFRLNMSYREMTDDDPVPLIFDFHIQIITFSTS